MNNLLEFKQFDKMLNEGVRDKNSRGISTGTIVKFRHGGTKVKGKVERVGIKYKKEHGRNLDNGLELHIEIIFPEKQKGIKVKKDPTKVEAS